MASCIDKAAQVMASCLSGSEPALFFSVGRAGGPLSFTPTYGLKATVRPFKVQAIRASASDKAQLNPTTLQEREEDETALLQLMEVLAVCTCT